MASTETGELYTQEQYDGFTPQQREELGIVHLNSEEQELLAQLSPEERLAFLNPPKPRKVRGAFHDPRYTKTTFTGTERRKNNKIERQRKKQGRNR